MATAMKASMKAAMKAMKMKSMKAPAPMKVKKVMKKELKGNAKLKGKKAAEHDIKWMGYTKAEIRAEKKKLKGQKLKEKGKKSLTSKNLKNHNDDKAAQEMSLKDAEICYKRLKDITKSGKELTTEQKRELLDAKLVLIRNDKITEEEVDKDEKHRLWDRLKKSKDKDVTGNAKSSWALATDQKSKNTILSSWIKDPSWGQKFVSRVGHLISTKSRNETNEWISYKELCDKHGKEEADSLIKAGAVRYREHPKAPNIWQFLNEKEVFSKHVENKKDLQIGQEDKKIQGNLFAIRSIFFCCCVGCGDWLSTEHCYFALLQSIVTLPFYRALLLGPSTGHCCLALLQGNVVWPFYRAMLFGTSTVHFCLALLQGIFAWPFYRAL